MRSLPNSDGFTLLELALAVLLVAMVVSWSVPSVRGGLDRLAVQESREGLISSLSRARALAPERGGGFVVLRPDSGTVLWGAGSDTLGHRMLPLLPDPGSAGSSSRPVTFRFDDLGLGQAASRTVWFTRGRARGGVTVSAYGRVRRR